MAQLTGNIEHFLFEVAGSDEELKVVRFNGTETICQLFQYQLELASENSELDFNTLIGQAGLLTCLGADDTVERYVHGIISEIRQGEAGKRFTTYHVTLVPQTWLLKHRRDCRIFQNKTVPDIIKQVFADAGIPSDQFKLILQGSYPSREYSVQYRESDLHFITRLMEQEGLFYYFEHSAESHLLIISDNASAHKPITDPATLPYHESTGLAPTEDSIVAFSYGEKVRPGKVMLRDFNFKKPSLNLQSDHQYEKDLPLEIYDYPGKYDSADHGRQLATYQLESWQVARKRGHGKSDCLRLIPGFRFTLKDHPRADLDQEYLITQVTCEGTQPQVLQEGASGEGSRYNNQFQCIPSSVPYRPEINTYKPMITGIQTAIVSGPQGEEIYTDEFGRVKVQFHWDRQGQYDENSSCWIRVSQAWAGTGWGAMFLPRIGQEVIVDFIEGDPDRPIITGRVYHGTNRPPYPLPDEKTKSTMKSNSSKGGEGFNEIRFEDKKGEEQIFIHAEKDQDIRVKNDVKEWIGHDRHLIVNNDQYEQVDKDKHQQVKGDHNQKIDGTFSIDVGSDVQQKTANNYAHEAGSEIHLKAGSKFILEAGSEITIKAGGSFIKLDASGVTVVGSMVKLNSGGSPGSGKGASPDAPKAPLEAANDKTGEFTEAPQAPEAYSPAALVLKQAAKDGTPFCEKCAAAAK